MKVLRKMLLNLLQSGVSGKAGTGIGDESRKQPEFLNWIFHVETNQQMNEIDRLTNYSVMKSV